MKKFLIVILSIMFSMFLVGWEYSERPEINISAMDFLKDIHTLSIDDINNKYGDKDMEISCFVFDKTDSGIFAGQLNSYREKSFYKVPPYFVCIWDDEHKHVCSKIGYGDYIVLRGKTTPKITYFTDELYYYIVLNNFDVLTTYAEPDIRISSRKIAEDLRLLSSKEFTKKYEFKIAHVSGRIQKIDFANNGNLFYVLDGIMSENHAYSVGVYIGDDKEKTKASAKKEGDLVTLRGFIMPYVAGKYEQVSILRIANAKLIE